MRKRLLRSSAILASSIASMLPHGHAKAEAQSKGNGYSKKLRESVLSRPDLRPTISEGIADPPNRGADRFPWKRGIVTTTFWVGETPTKNNPVPNHASSWDQKWAENFGGLDDPNKANRANYMPVNFVPRQNPFYVALPYNDVQKGGLKPEASQVIPWFKQAYRGPTKTVCKGRWLAIRYKDRVVYAQWEDCGPFRTDHWQYVFGNERPKPNLNKGAGLDVSPAVRDYLGMSDTDVTDWKFVDFEEVPPGPWATHGDNNTFVINRRKSETQLASASLPAGLQTPAPPAPASAPKLPTVSDQPLDVGPLPASVTPLSTPPPLPASVLPRENIARAPSGGASKSAAGSTKWKSGTKAASSLAATGAKKKKSVN